MVAKRICNNAKLSTRANTRRIGRTEVDALYQAIQDTKISAPSTDCISPIGEELLLKGLHEVVPAEFYAAATRPPNVYRGNPFLVEVAIAYGGASTTARKVSKEMLAELLSESDARTLRQFLTMTFNGMGSDGAAKILGEAGFGRPCHAGQVEGETDRHTASRPAERKHRRRPDDERLSVCQPCAVVVPTRRLRDHTDRDEYELEVVRPFAVARFAAQRAGDADGAIWPAFGCRSRARARRRSLRIRRYKKDIRLALQSVGRKLGMYLRRRQKVRQEGERRNVFSAFTWARLPTPVSVINEADARPVVRPFA